MTSYTRKPSIRSKSPRPLKHWLQDATQDLCDDAAQRITAEVTAHYWDALAGYLSRGFPERAARRYALACLGDADAARKGFQKTYLVKWQERYLSYLAHVPEKSAANALEWFVHCALLSFSFSLLDYFPNRALSSLSFAAIALAVILLLAKGCVSVVHTDRRYRGLVAPEDQVPTVIGRFNSRWPTLTACILVALSVHYSFALTDPALPGIFRMGVAALWAGGVRAGHRFLFGKTWRHKWHCTLLAVAMGLGLLALSATTGLPAIPSLLRFAELSVNPQIQCATLALLAAFLFCAAIMTFVGAWLIQKRGNRSSQVTPEPLRNDAV